MSETRFDAATIVVLGSLNPAIVRPVWLLRHGLIRPSEVDEPVTDAQVVTPEFANFAIGNWATLNVGFGRLQATASDASGMQPLRDLVCGIFGILRETPVTAVGFNRAMHLVMDSDDQRHQLGHLLAPKPPWDSLLDGPMMASVTMEGRRTGSQRVLRITVEPSKKLTSQPGVFVAVNEHYNVADTSGLAEIVSGQAMDSWEHSRLLAEKIVSLVKT